MRSLKSEEKEEWHVAAAKSSEVVAAGGIPTAKNSLVALSSSTEAKFRVEVEDLLRADTAEDDDGTFC